MTIENALKNYYKEIIVESDEQNLAKIFVFECTLGNSKLETFVNSKEDREKQQLIRHLAICLIIGKVNEEKINYCYVVNGKLELTEISITNFHYSKSMQRLTKLLRKFGILVRYFYKNKIDANFFFNNFDKDPKLRDSYLLSQQTEEKLIKRANETEEKLKEVQIEALETKEKLKKELREVQIEAMKTKEKLEK
jgi:hypothetical protein